MMNRKAALEAFKEYVNLFNVSDIKIKLKIDHTYRVSDISSRIGAAVGADSDFCWFLGLLHDIGRFEQLTRFGTFIDRDSVDHAELGADILFKGVDEEKPLIDTFPSDVFGVFGDAGIERKRREIAETAVRLHNKLNLPNDLDAEAVLYCKVLRDADKVDIFRVLTEPPYDERNQRIKQCSREDGAATPAREEIMLCVREHRCVPKTFERSDFESLISLCCMAFELAYPISRKIAKEQGYLDQLMNLPVKDPVMAGQLETLRSEME